METDWHFIDEIRERFLELDLTVRVTHAPSDTGTIEPRLPRLLVLLRAFPMGSLLTVVHRTTAEHRELDIEQTEEIRDALRELGFPDGTPRIDAPGGSSRERDLFDLTGTIAGAPFTLLLTLTGGQPFTGPDAAKLAAFMRILFAHVDVEPALRTLLAGSA